MKRWLFACLLAGCSGGATAHGETTTSHEEAQAIDESHDLDLRGVPSRTAEPTVDAPPAGDNLGREPFAGTIDRTRMILIVDQGLGRFFGQLKLRPSLDGKRFVGWEVVGIDPAWGETGIRVGDVLLRVNGQAIDRPEAAMTAFESLRVASEVLVELTRAGVPASLRYRIQ
jgi:hypothetical protein